MSEAEASTAVAIFNLTPDSWLVIRRGRPGRLLFSLGHEDPSQDTRPVVVDLAALLVDLQLNWEDCRNALDNFGDQGMGGSP